MFSETYISIARTDAIENALNGKYIIPCLQENVSFIGGSKLQVEKATIHYVSSRLCYEE